MAQQEEDRECSMTIAFGSQGAGKSYYNMYLIRDYCTDNIQTKVMGRKTLILDSNGEFAKSQWVKNGINNFESKTIAVKDIAAFANPNSPIECRRVDMKNLLIAEKLDVLVYAINNFSVGLLLVEDPNSYVLSMTFMEEIIGRMVSLRHRGLDVILSFQGLRACNPVVYRNTKWVRYHHQLDNAYTVTNKVTNVQLYKLAQILVDNRYETGDIRFKVFLNQLGNKIEGTFTKPEFETACRQLLNIERKELKEHMNMHKVSEEVAYEAQIKKLCKRYLV